ncbi:LmeA family phospholipid-binding protein [Actinacidiphila guanduensis]|uniref:DUF2993 domain-containing protein n=1 Tax=Actinacidiphila guanduensis TaxID=310781 RepID=A0A1H0MSU2_9ACTN|nr:DUF2993 domain-containing protein [Actinacidiphila guanduensis]SDO83462.1 Protein of unknown function [Actinacidiphila guanduensis]
MSDVPNRPIRRFPPLRRKPLVVTASALAGACVLALLADVALEHTARERIVRAAACKLRPAGRVSARLDGSLAGLRLLTGEVGSVHIEAEDVRRQGMDLSVAADLYHVTTKGRTSGGTATATLSYAALGNRIGDGMAGLRPQSDGHGGLLLTGTISGVPLPVTVHTGLTAAGDRLTVTPTDVSVLGEDFPVAHLAANPTTSRLAGKLAPRTVAIPQLPSGVRLTGVHTAPDGVELALSLPRSIAGAGNSTCAA